MFLFLASAINVGDHLSAMADAVKLLVGGASAVYALTFGIFSVVVTGFFGRRNFV